MFFSSGCNWIIFQNFPFKPRNKVSNNNEHKNTYIINCIVHACCRMAKRPCRMTREQVLNMLSDSVDQDEVDASEDSEDELEAVDDPLEPIMDG